MAQFSSTFPTQTHWYMTDHLGTPFLQTDAFGAIAWRVEYEPYGDIWLSVSPRFLTKASLPASINRCAFPGRKRR